MTYPSALAWNTRVRLGERWRACSWWGGVGHRWLWKEEGLMWDWSGPRRKVEDLEQSRR